MPSLGVNIDHVATLREIRKGVEPEPVLAALIAQAAGVDSVVVHLREDRRHIKERDLYLLKEVVKVKLNLEMAVAPEIVKIASQVRPDQATLVPEKRQELTTEGGLDVAGNSGVVEQALCKLQSRGIEVSLFIDPDKHQINASKKIGAKIIELHTGRYAEAKNLRESEKYLREIKQAALYAREKGFRVFAGHGLNYYNVVGVAKIKQIEELNIGYSIVCRSLITGLEEAIRQMNSLIKG